MGGRRLLIRVREEDLHVNFKGKEGPIPSQGTAIPADMNNQRRITKVVCLFYLCRGYSFFFGPWLGYSSTVMLTGGLFVSSKLRPTTPLEGYDVDQPKAQGSETSYDSSSIFINCLVTVFFFSHQKAE